MSAAQQPTYEEILGALQQLEARFKRLEKAHSDLLDEVQARIAELQQSIEQGMTPRRH